MARARFNPDVAGYRELMKSGAMQSLVNSAAEQMVSMATSMTSSDEMDNPPFTERHGVDEVAAWAYVSTSSPHGENAESKNRVLTKAFNSVGV